MAVKRSGFTLPELLVGSALLGLLTTLLFSVLVPTMKGVKQTEADVESQQAALIAVDKLFHQLAFSDQRSVTLYETESRIILSFLSAEPVSGPGGTPVTAADIQTSGTSSAPVVWKKFVIEVFDAATGELSWREYAYTGGSNLATLKSSRLNNVLATASAAHGVTARGLRVFQVVLPRPGVIRLYLETIRASVKRDRTTNLEIEIAMRQGL